MLGTVRPIDLRNATRFLSLYDLCSHYTPQALLYYILLRVCMFL